MTKLKINYSNTIIYRLVCKNPVITDCYIGYTTNFTQRKRQHKSCCTNDKSKNFNNNVYVFIRENGNWENWDMIEIEKLADCIDSNEAMRRERYWIETYKSTLNSYSPILNDIERKKQKQESTKIYREMHSENICKTAKQYYERNKDKLVEYSNKYYELNKDKMREKRNEYLRNYRLKKKLLKEISI